MPNVRGTDNSARKQRPSLTETQSAKRKQGYSDKQDKKNKKAKAEEKIAKAGFFVKKAGGGKKQPDNQEDAVANAVANMGGAEGSGEGSADAILDGIEEEDNLWHRGISWEASQHVNLRGGSEFVVPKQPLVLVMQC